MLRVSLVACQYFTQYVGNVNMRDLLPTIRIEPGNILMINVAMCFEISTFGRGPLTIWSRAQGAIHPRQGIVHTKAPRSL